MDEGPQPLDSHQLEQNRRAWAVSVLSLSTLSLIILLVSYILWSSYSSNLDKARQSTVFVANLVAAQTEASLKGLEIILSGVQREMQFSLLDMDKKLSDEVGDYLRDVKQSNLHLMDLLVLDSTGQITQWTGKGVPPDVSDRTYAQWHIDNPASEFYLGEPLLSKVHQGRWFFALSMAIRDDQQRLQKILVAIVDIEHFRVQLEDIELPPDSSLGLMSRERHVITRLPGHSKFVGVKLTGLNVNRPVEDGSVDITSSLDHVDRIAGYHRIDRYGIAAFASTSRQQLQKKWLQYVAISGLLLLALIFILGFLTLRILRNQSAMHDQQKQLVILASIDGLTGLYNRRYGLNRLTEEFKRARRYQYPLSLFMVDIDYFKKVNDSYGHAAGDVALKAVTDILRTTCREQDIISRYGGEEFLVMLPETALDEAVRLAERLRKTIEQASIRLGSTDLKMTISIGVASCDLGSDNENDQTTSIQQADRALYRAKEEGRNRVCVSE